MPFCVCGNKSKTKPEDPTKREVPPGEGPTGKKIYVTRDVPDAVIKMLQEHFKVEQWKSQSVVPRDNLLQGVKGASAILCTISDCIDRKVLEAAGSDLEMVCTMSSDTNHIDTRCCEVRNVRVQHAADECADVTAEMTCALLLTTARRLIEGHDALLNDECGPWKPMWLCGVELRERTLGILGFGRVGWGVAHRLQNFGLDRIIYFDTNVHPLARDVGAKKVDIETLFAESDFLVCCLSLTPETRGIVREQYLSLCKPECIFINTTRGELVNHYDLAKALEENTIFGAGLDVTDPEPLPPDHPLHAFPNCIITPHIGTSTDRTGEHVAIILAQSIITNLG